MADNTKLNIHGSEDETASVESGVKVSEAVTTAAMVHGDGKSRDISYGSGLVQETKVKDQELSEQIKHKDEVKGTIPCLPSINLSELTTILLSPNMPSQKIMKEVADKIMLKSEESESDDGSVGSTVGMKGVLDCIFEVTFMHDDSDTSDDDESFERISREIPCTFCNKIFGSTMKCNTHVLVAHPQLEPSVLNIKRTSSNESDQKEKNHSTHKKHFTRRSSSKAEHESKDQKAYHTATDVKQAAELPQDEENRPFGKRRASFSRSQQKEVLTGKCEERKKRDRIQSIPSVESEKETKEQYRTHSSNITVDSIDHGTTADQTVGETHVGKSNPAKSKSRSALPPDVDGTKHETEQSQLSDLGSKKRKVSEDKLEGSVTVISDLVDTSQSLAGESKLTEDSPPEKKMKISLSQASSTSSEASPSSKQSRKHVTKEPAHKHSSRFANITTPKDEQNQSERTRKVPTRKSSRHL